MTPRVVDKLTPNGEIPDEDTVLSKVTGFSGNFSAAAAAGALTTTLSISSSGGFGSVLKYILPILLLTLLSIAGYWLFKSNRPAAATDKIDKPVVVNANANTAKTVESSFKIKAKDGKYSVSGLIPDLETFDKIKAKLTAQFGKGNVDFADLRVDPQTKPFADGGWSNFSQMLQSVGYGDANPVGDNTTEDGRFRNRRIEYKKADGNTPTT